jgi:hypothetical protein
MESGMIKSKSRYSEQPYAAEKTSLRELAEKTDLPKFLSDSQYQYTSQL